MDSQRTREQAVERLRQEPAVEEAVRLYGERSGAGPGLQAFAALAAGFALLDGVSRGRAVGYAWDRIDELRALGVD